MKIIRILILCFFTLVCAHLSFAQSPRAFYRLSDGLYAPPKDPLAQKDYGFNWQGWLQPGDTIVASSWTSDTGIGVLGESFTANTSVVWLTGGTDGTKYQLTNTITTAGGRTEVARFKISVASQY